MQQNSDPPVDKVRELERQLEASRRGEARLRALLEAASQALVAVDGCGNIILVNTKTEEIFGYPRAELLGQPLEKLLPQRYRHVHAEHRVEYLAHPRARPMGLGMDLSGVRRDGTEFPIEISLSWIEEEGAQVAFAFITDISERKRLEEKLRHTQKLESLGVLAGGVAHDFNNLLTGVMGNASITMDTLAPSHPAREYLESIVKASERAADLTRQLLAYTGKGRFAVGEIDLSELLREIAGLVTANIPKTVQLRMALDGGLPPIEGDASQIEQLATNLIVNAGEAIGEGSNGTVLVSTGVEQVDEHDLAAVLTEAPVRPGAYVYLEVRDSGTGMDEQTLSRIFDPFFSTKFTGRGLGLAAVSGIVRSHRGAIQVESEPGRGTTFKVLFPVAHARQAAATPARPELGEKGLVLVVDDEVVVRHTARAALERRGYAVLLAEDGRAAVNLFRDVADRVTVVLLDMSMPGISSEETLRLLQRIRPDVKVVLSTGYDEQGALRRFEGKGLAGFIQKPYTAAQLAQKVQAAL